MARGSGGTDGQKLVAFYEGSGRDDAGRTLEDVLAYDDSRIEGVHDFIQWLFPLRARSGANPSAPRLDDEAIAAFRERPELRDNVRRSLDRMLAFYGFERKGEDIEKAADFLRHDRWLTRGNHNHLRLTRMIASLRLLGEEALAKALYARLRSIYEEEWATGRCLITDTTFAFWKDAAS